MENNAHNISEEAVKAMPERIYAKVHGASTDVISGQRGLIGGWNEYQRYGQMEYVRSDLIATYQAAALAQAIQIAERPVIGFSDGAVEASRYIASSISALTAALPFLSVQGAVKEVIADYVEKFPLAKLVGDWPYEHDADAAFDTGARAQRLTVAQAIRDMELTISEPSAARELALEEAAQAVEALKGRSRSPQVLQGFGDARREAAAAIRALSSPDHADAVGERAWYFRTGDVVPEWLEKIEKGNCTLTFGVDVVVTSKDGGYEVRPQGIADDAWPILHVVNHGNVTPEIKGGGNGVAIIGYNRPYDETAGWRIARLKRLLEMARPYVECYDTREHNSEQDAVLTEIDKALSVVVGETHADAGKLDAVAICKKLAPYLGATEANDWTGLKDDDAISMTVKMRVGDLRTLKAVATDEADAGKVEGDEGADLERYWRPISEADKSITFEHTFDLGDGEKMTIRNSDHYWVRDADGRVYEATWSDHKGGYWWDLEGESPVDPVEYMPHPLSIPSAPASEGAE